MEHFHWLRHRCRQLLASDAARGWYSGTLDKSPLEARGAPCSLDGKRRTVIARHGPLQAEYHRLSKGYQGNGIHTTKYSVLTFIPVNLFQQFHRVANLYFLFLVLLNWVPAVEAFQKEITMVPLLVVLGVIAVKDALEDYRRYLFDKRVNNNSVCVYSSKQKAYVDQCWQDVRVGDFIWLSCNEIIPADVLLLHSSDPRGICYIETANLDGETNLKQRQVVTDLPLQGSELTPERFYCRIECENPNNNLGRFRGYMENADQVRVGLHNDNLLLRSCTIRNTDAVVGIVIYAGHESKAMMNNSGPRYKRSRLEKRLNMDVLWCVLLLIVMCLTVAVGHGLWLGHLNHPIYLVAEETSPALAGFYVFWTMIIVLQVLIPISLYVSIEVVKLGQIFFIQNDLALYHEPVDSGIQCRALNITEDLGQIQYLFSDKTGTLTENKMVFQCCTIYGVQYPHNENARRLEVYEQAEVSAPGRSLTLRSGRSVKSLSCHSMSCHPSTSSLHTLTAEEEEEGEEQSQRTVFGSRMAKDVVPDPELLMKLNSLVPADGSCGAAPSRELTYIVDFFLALAICNSVVVSSPRQPSHMSRGSPNDLTSRPFSQCKTESFPSKTSTRNAASQEGAHMDSERDQIASDVQYIGTRDEKNDLLPIAGQVSPEDRSGVPREHGQIGARGLADGELVYEAESPDEAALVHAARAYRCTLRGRSVETLSVDLLGVGCRDVHLLHILPFDSARKRMSVVVRHPMSGKVVVYTKGADSVIMDLAEEPQGPADATEVYAQIREQTQKHLDHYARDGLRTLCIAKKAISKESIINVEIGLITKLITPYIDTRHKVFRTEVVEEEEYQAWLEGRLLAETSIENREELLMESAQRLECNLTLLGATGVVDRLQEEVPETIEALQKAGIKVWVLTGDKQETAINIACACKLLGPTDQILTANCGSKDACEVLLQDLLAEVGGLAGRRAEEASPSTAGGFTLVIDGRTLDWALQEDLKGTFLELSQRCMAVICCRSTPLQKSQVVQLVRDQLNVMTLAIGDGANDVSMIQVADVGVGICGQEGMQAVMSSDFAISRFKHLRRLLLVHGHWCSSRLANMVLYFFYKNVMFVNLLFWYQFFSGFSGSVMTNSWILIFFNLLFTSVPPLVYGVLDRHTPADTLMAWPELYRAAPHSKIYVSSTFWLTILDAFYQSLVCFFIPYLAYAGSDVGVLAFGSPINASALLIILLHQVIESHTLTWIHTVVLLGSAIFYFVFTSLFSTWCVTCSPPTNPLGVETLQMSRPLFYLVCALTTVTALVPRVLVRVLRNTMSPSAMMRPVAQVEESGPENDARRTRWWNRTQSRTRELSVSVDNPALEPADDLVVS